MSKPQAVLGASHILTQQSLPKEKTKQTEADVQNTLFDTEHVPGDQEDQIVHHILQPGSPNHNL